MLSIERSRGFDQVVSTGSWESIRQFTADCEEAYLEYLRQVEGVEGTNYRATITDISEIPDEFRGAIVNPSSDIYFQDVTFGPEDFRSRTVTVFDLLSGRGLQRDFNRDGLPEDFELTSNAQETDFPFTPSTHRLIKAIFVPDSHPELLPLADDLRARLVPEDLPARLHQPEDHPLHAKFVLDRFTAKHFTDLIDIYWEVAWPGYEQHRAFDNNAAEYIHRLKQQEAVGLRTAALGVPPAKHQFSPGFDGEVTTSMYLNYDIDIPPVRLYFAEDIAKESLYAKLARQYFDEHNLTFNQ